MEAGNMTKEQKTRQDELQAKETLEPAEAEELKVLTALPQEIEEADPDEEFGDAWDELDGKKKDPEKTPEEIQAEKEKADAAAAKEAEDAAAAAKAKDPSTEPTEADKALLNATLKKPDKPDSSVDQSAEVISLKTQLAALDHKMASWDGRIKAAENRAALAEQKLKEAEDKGTKTGSDSASPDVDDAELSAFFKEFPTLEGPIQKVAERAINKIVKDKLGKVEVIEQRQTDLTETLQEEANVEHMLKIEGAHKDWKAIYDSGALTTWIEQQPKFLQPRLTEIIAKGSAADIIEMYDSYKRATGKGKETTTDTELTAEKKKKLADMEAVRAASAGPKTEGKKVEKEDFDGSWDELEKEDQQKK